MREEEVLKREGLRRGAVDLEASGDFSFTIVVLMGGVICKQGSVGKF